LNLHVNSGVLQPVPIKSALIKRLEAGTSIRLYDTDSADAEPMIIISAPYMDVKEDILISNLMSSVTNLGNLFVFVAQRCKDDGGLLIKKASIFNEPTKKFLIL
jgi:hypothetical protein